MARFYGLFLIVLLVGVSGVIAYIGDIVGRRLGRKRVSLFGMRPRHTAIVFSVLAGMGITICTLVAAMLVSNQVRAGFFQVGEMRSERKELERALARVRGQRSRLDRELKRSEKLAQEQKKLLQDTGKQVKSLQAQQAKAGEALLATTSKLAKTDKQLAERQHELGNAELAIARETRLAQMRLKQADERVADVRNQPFMFSAGEVLGQEVISSKQPRWKTKDALKKLVARMKVVAGEAGAKDDPKSGPLVVAKPVLDKKTGRVAIFGEDQIMDTLTDEVASSKSDQVIVRGFCPVNTVKKELVPVDFQLFNNKLAIKEGTLLGSLDLQLSSDRLLFRSGADSGRMKLEADQPPELTLMTVIVSELLRKQVAKRGRDSNVMPEVARRPEGAGLFGSPPQTLGQISQSDLYKAAAAVRAKRGPVRVTAFAAQDVWTAGPLRVRLEVAAS